MDNESGISRRRGPDFWCRLIQWLERSTWLLAVVTLCLIGLAKPRGIFLYDRILGLMPQPNWNPNFLRWALLITIILSLSCIYGLFVNKHRHDRTDDHYSWVLILWGSLSLSGVIALAVWLSKLVR